MANGSSPAPLSPLKRCTLQPVSPANDVSYLPSGREAYSGLTMLSKRKTIMSLSWFSILPR